MAGWDVQLYAYIFSVYLCVCVVLCTAPFQCNARTAERIFFNDLMHAAPSGQSPVRAGGPRGGAEVRGAARALRGHFRFCALRQQISKSTTIRLIYNRKYALISLDKSMCIRIRTSVHVQSCPPPPPPLPGPPGHADELMPEVA